MWRDRSLCRNSGLLPVFQAEGAGTEWKRKSDGRVAGRGYCRGLQGFVGSTMCLSMRVHGLVEHLLNKLTTRVDVAGWLHNCMQLAGNGPWHSL